MDTQEAAHRRMCIKERLRFQRVFAVGNGNILSKKTQQYKQTNKPNIIK